MRLKVKQGGYSSKIQRFPPIKLQPGRRQTPRASHNNRSLPKIPALGIESVQENFNQLNKVQMDPPRKQFKERAKANHVKKRGKQNSSCNQESVMSNEQDEAGITNNFQKQIQRNLMMIKKEKQSHQRLPTHQKIRYQTSNSPEKSVDMPRDRRRQARGKKVQEEVFAKLNQIISKSQVKTPGLAEEDHGISASYKLSGKGGQNFRRQKMKTQVSREAYQRQVKPEEFKHDLNYIQWRKLSIDEDDSSKLSYNVSSYQIQTDRLEKIRNKNDLSLKKYFEGKHYLNKLVKYRDSTVLINHPH